MAKLEVVTSPSSFKVFLEINNEKIGICVAALSAVGLAYIFRKPIERTLFGLFGDPANPKIEDIQSGSLIVKLCFYTSESFLKFLDDYESGKFKKRLTEEFTKIDFLDNSLPAELRDRLAGIVTKFDIDDNLTIKIRNEKEVERYRDELKASMAKADDPPPLDITLPKLGDVNPPHKNWEDIELPIEVVLLTVKDYEFLSCYSYLENVFRSNRKNIGRIYFGEITAEDQGKVKISLVRCSEGATGVGAALNVIRNAVSFLKPKAVICVGFCGGLNPAKAKLGDVVISAKISTYAHKKVTSNGEELRGVRANVSKHMGDLIRYAADGWKAPLNSPGTREVKVYCNGEILSGPELVNCDVRREELLKKYETAIAIDMEGEGVYAACYDLQIEWLVVKGISDYAYGTKSETWQRFASVMAASVVHNILKEPRILKDWHHYGDI